jgi:hypothetical protein
MFRDKGRIFAMDGKKKDELASRLEGASWGAFFTQFIRSTAKLGVEGFWVVVGIFFALAGLWHLLGVGVDFGPIALVAAGAAVVLASILGHKHRHSD